MNAIASAGPVDKALIDDLVAASRILAHYGVLDAWGHVSMRHPNNPERYLLSRARAPALVTAEDIMEFDHQLRPGRSAGPPHVPGALHPWRGVSRAARTSTPWCTAIRRP